MGEFRKWMSHAQNVRNWFWNYALQVFSCPSPCPRPIRSFHEISCFDMKSDMGPNMNPNLWSCPTGSDWNDRSFWFLNNHSKICEWYLYWFHDRNWSSFTMFIRWWKTLRSTNLYWSFKRKAGFSRKRFHLQNYYFETWKHDLYRLPKIELVKVHSLKPPLKKCLLDSPSGPLIHVLMSSFVIQTRRDVVYIDFKWIPHQKEKNWNISKFGK